MGPWVRIPPSPLFATSPLLTRLCGLQDSTGWGSFGGRSGERGLIMVSRRKLSGVALAIGLAAGGFLLGTILDLPFLNGSKADQPSG